MAGFLGLDELFEGRHFDREIIVLCVRWYLRFKLSFRDLVEIMAERDLSVAHTTIMRWVHHYACVDGPSDARASDEKSDGWVDCDHVSGLLARQHAAGPDGFRDPDPNTGAAS
jgi:hypothetical protein